MKSKSNPKPTVYDICEECGAPYAELHEIFGGNPGRHYSQEYGLQVRLCYMDHRNSPTGIHYNEELQKKWKRWAKEKFINDRINEGIDQEEAEKLFFYYFGGSKHL